MSCLYATPKTKTLAPFMAFRLSFRTRAARSTQYSGMRSLIIMDDSIMDVWKPYSRAFHER